MLGLGAEVEGQAPRGLGQLGGGAEGAGSKRDLGLAGVARVDLADAQAAVLAAATGGAGKALGPAHRGQHRDARGLRAVTRQENAEAKACWNWTEFYFKIDFFGNQNLAFTEM